MPTDLSEFQVDLVSMLQRFYAGHVDNFDDRDIMRRVQAAMVHVAQFEPHYSGLWPELTVACTSAVAVAGVPTIEQLIILRDRRRQIRAAATQATKCDNGQCNRGRAWTTDAAVALDKTKLFCCADCADEWAARQALN